MRSIGNSWTTTRRILMSNSIIPSTTVPSNLSKLTHAQKDELINSLVEEIKEVRSAANEMVKEALAQKVVVVKPEEVAARRTVKSGVPTPKTTVSLRCNTSGPRHSFEMDKDEYVAARKNGITKFICGSCKA